MVEVTSECSWRQGAGHRTRRRVSSLQSCFHEVQWISYDDADCTTDIASPEVSGHGYPGMGKETSVNC
jgi:hypothetical protein